VLNMAARERQSEQLAQLNELIRPTDGKVLQDGNLVILRLTGLPFKPGTAILKSSATPVLQRVSKAVALFPRATISVEGHTDNRGDALRNERLSGDQATTVAATLSRVLQLAPEQLQVSGVGGARPIADNDSPSGRARNRRVDIVITPPAN
jgi:OmpA-OmpF porin, OOP family